MYANLSESIKRRMLGELREFWSNDPKYRDFLVHNIQGRYSFEERPQQAIILKSTSANPINFSADHYQGTIVSYCHLARVFGRPGTSIEWVKEDSTAIQRNNGTFPSPAGIYYVEVLKEVYEYRGVPGEYLVFYVDPLLDVVDENPTFIDPLTYEVSAGRFHPGSFQAFEMPGNIRLYNGVHYSADPTTGRITLVEPMSSGTHLSVDYRYPGTTVGPFPVEENGSNNQAIPGVVLAFGRKAEEGDIMAVITTTHREEQALEYGGRWEMSLEFDVMARDVNAQGEITDRTLMFLHNELRERLSASGVEITSVSMGGEGEEMYDETGDDYFYTASISVSLMTDWFAYKPLSRSLSRVLPYTVSDAEKISGLSDQQLAELSASPAGLRLNESLQLIEIKDPWYRDRSKSWDLIL